MSHSDGLLDPTLQQGHLSSEAGAAPAAPDDRHHPDYSPLATAAAVPLPPATGGQHAQGGHSIQDIQASQILSHFQFAPAGSVAGGSMQPHAAPNGLEIAAGPLQQQQQQHPSTAGPPFDPYAVYAATNVQPSDGTAENNADGGVSQLGSIPSHQAHAHGHPQQQQQQQLGPDFGAYVSFTHQQQGPGGLQAQSYPSTAGPSSGARNGPYLQHPQPMLDSALNKRSYETFADDGGAAAGSESDGNDADIDDIHDVTYLRREVKRLRRALRQSAVPPVVESGSSGSQGFAPQQVAADYYAPIAPASLGIAGGLVAETSAAGARRSGNGGGRRPKKVEELDEEEKRKRNALTGKRETTPRHHALNKAIRDRMKDLMGVGADERLPSPHDPQPLPADGSYPAGGQTRIYHRPDWKAGVKNEANKVWLEGVARAVVNDGWQALRSPPTSAKDSRLLIPAEDLDFELAFKAARTAFSNFTKKWVSQTDPVAMQKAITDAKRGRRWARKDLKQKKRSRAALDEAYASIYSQQPHPHILKLDYMSSECSSEGDDAGLDHGRLPEGEWERRSGRDPNPELNKGKGEKVLEIRTPRWRSERLTEIFGNLDEIAALQAKAVKGNFYTAPALKRFKLQPLRDLPVPLVADLPLETWEFDPSWLGQPSEQADDVRRKLGQPPLLVASASGSVTAAAGQQQQQQQQQQQGLDPAFVYGLEMMQAMEGYGQPSVEGAGQ